MIERVFAVLFFAVGALAQTQPAQTSEQGGVFRVSVTLVQIDAVVTDSKGRHVADLEPGDFEVLQDGKPQKITHFSYIRTRSETPAPKRSADATAPPPPPVRLRPEQVRRTIALVVDDLSLSFESMNYVRRALNKFVDEQMQTGDLAAVLRTSAGLGAFQQFTTDKRQLHAAIERIRWSPFGRQSVSFGVPLEGDTEQETAGREAADRFEEFRQEIFSVGTLGAINYVVRGLRDVPGRKSVVLFSDGMPIVRKDGDTGRVLEALERLADEANRASTVIYTVDARGLLVLMPGAAESFPARADIGRVISERQSQYYESQNGLNFMAAQTGGLFLHEMNDLSEAVQQVLEDQAGYYLLGYGPGADTFGSRKGEALYHRIQVRVKRAGLKLRSRSGFYGVPDQEARAAVPRGRDEQLQAALASPFAATAVELRLTALFTYNPKAGPYIYSWLHMGGAGFTFTEEADGWHKTVIDLILSTFGENGQEVDRSNKTFTVQVRGQEYKAALENGFVLSTIHNPKKPGAYQLRVAVRDAASGRVGSASQFIEIPDLKKNRLALSGIALRSYDSYAANRMKAPAGPGNQTEGQVRDPDPQGGPALRIFRPGRTLAYGFLVFNARTDRQTKKQALDLQFRFFRDGQQLWASPARAVPAGQQVDEKCLAAGGYLKLNSQIRPGDYVFQVIATDRLAKGKNSTAIQWIDFAVAQ